MGSIRTELRRIAADRARALLARLLVVVATGGCAAPLDLPVSPEAPSGTIPVVTVASVSRTLARPGDTVEARFSADGAISGCATSLDKGAFSSEARCEPDGLAGCACALFVDATVPDGAARLTLCATNAHGKGAATRALQVDVVPPVVEPAT